MISSLPRLFAQARARGEKLAMISLYDAPSAAVCCDAGADILLVGDSMGNVVLGHDNTVPVTMDAMLHHTSAVIRGVRSSSRPEVPVVADLPFGSYATVDLAVKNGADLMRAGAQAVKLEGGGRGALACVEALVEMGVPVVGHLGYTPQSSMRFEGVLQGKTSDAADRLLTEARQLEEAGCCAIILEIVPVEVAARLTRELGISTVGIGAGPECDAQVLVWHDLAGLSSEKPFRFVKKYADGYSLIRGAAEGFVSEVHSGEFPAEEHGWKMAEDELRGWRDGE